MLKGDLEGGVKGSEKLLKATRCIEGQRENNNLKGDIEVLKGGGEALNGDGEELKRNNSTIVLKHLYTFQNAVFPVYLT